MKNQTMIWRCDLVPQYRKYKDELDQAISRVLNSGRYTLSDEVRTFEEEFAKYIGCRFGIGVGNGTDGLILSLKALEIGSSDEVITTSFTAIPTISAIIAVGAKPVFVDTCPDSFLMDLDRVSTAITPKTKAVVAVHLFGNVVDISLLKNTLPSNIRIIEDACQAHGSSIRGHKAGAMGDLGVFSFYPTKNLGGYGDGGMIITNDDGLAKKLKLIRMYGMTDKDHIAINGINSRLDELQAAILCVKLKYLDEMNKRRNEVIQRYKNQIRKDALKYQYIQKYVTSNHHIFAAKSAYSRKKLIDYLTKHKIQTNIYYPIPAHLQQANAYLGWKEGDLPSTEELCETIIALPIYPEIETEKIDYITKIINQFKES